MTISPWEIEGERHYAFILRDINECFLKVFSRKVGRSVTDISSGSLDRLMHYHWPGNVRELQNIIERATILSDGPIDEVADSVLAPISTQQTQSSGKNLIEVERDHITNVLKETSWTIEGKGGAAAILGLAPSTLRSRMTKFGITRPES